jgi:hypothetical protein
MRSDPLTTPDPAVNVSVADDDMPSPLLRRRFEVASVDKVDVPDGAQGGEWYRYVLMSGPARITGYHRGTSEEVTDYAESCAADFNLRNATCKGAGSLASKKTR